MVKERKICREKREEFNKIKKQRKKEVNLREKK
jgi:hypothetical protein